MYHDLVFPSIVVHWAYGVSGGSPSTLETRLQSLEPFTKVAVLGCICEENLNLRFLFSMNSIPCFRHLCFSILCSQSRWMLYKVLAQERVNVIFRSFDRALRA